jgi:hypothetical protein
LETRTPCRDVELHYLTVNHILENFSSPSIFLTIFLRIFFFLLNKKNLLLMADSADGRNFCSFYFVGKRETNKHVRSVKSQGSGRPSNVS